MIDNLYEVNQLKKWFELRGSFIETLKGKKTYVKAVDGISFNIEEGEILGLVGESGSGKTTVGRLLLNLIPKTNGEIYFKGEGIETIIKQDKLQFRRKTQIILQDPFGSLNPRMTVYDLIGESIEIHNLAENKKKKEELITKAMENVDLTPIEDFINKYPNELSGGQMQRVSIARTLVLDPKFIVCDEPISMLDASIKANILNLLLYINDKFGVSQLYITHDLASARYISNRIAVMYLGKIVELAETEELIENPLHPYTKALFSAVPNIDPTIVREEVDIKGEISDAINLPSGCIFHNRCLFSNSKCKEIEPKLIDLDGHQVACHLINKNERKKT